MIASLKFLNFFSCGTFKLQEDDSQEENILLPRRPLAPGSLEVVSNVCFTRRKESDDAATFLTLKKIIALWEKKGIQDYLIYGLESRKSDLKFRWEIVPFPKNGFRFWNQFKVLWNVTFGGPPLNSLEKKQLDSLLDNLRFENGETSTLKNEKKVAKDAFCDPKVIGRQVVHEGKEVRILYNYAPVVLGEKKLHFLIVPKRHLTKFSELKESEYLEAMGLLRKLVIFYKKEGQQVAYFFDKTGRQAGQTVPHWHQHVIFTATKTEEFLGKLKILKNMLIGSYPLREKELQARVTSLRKELASIG